MLHLAGMAVDVYGRFISHPVRASTIKIVLAPRRLAGVQLDVTHGMSRVALGPDASQLGDLRPRTGCPRGAGGPAIQIDEDDVTQLAVARHCRNFVLSQSSFHIWMAYAAIRPRHVVIFNGSDPMNTGVDAPPWMPVPWIVL